MYSNIINKFFGHGQIFAEFGANISEWEHLLHFDFNVFSNQMKKLMCDDIIMQSVVKCHSL